MLYESIYHWLDQLPTTEKTTKPSLKRRYTNPLTPEGSMSSQGGSSNKRRRQDQTTPTARSYQKRLQTNKATVSFPPLPSDYSQDSQASGRSSPQKQQIRALEESADGIRIQDIAGLKDPTPRLDTLLRCMRRLSRGSGILPLSMREELAASERLDLEELAEEDHCFTAVREQIGTTPSLESVLEILEAAMECSNQMHAEPSWNAEVHHRVLSLALRSSGSTFSQFVNFLSW